MKAFIVFAAVIAIAAANAVGRVSGGWGAPPSPSIDLELSAAAAAAAAGSASAGQQLLELVSGTPEAPSSLSSANGVLAEVSQGESISQIGLANIPSGATSTINAVDVGNEAIAIDSLDAALSGGLGASVSNSAQTDAQGEGAIAAEAASSNIVASRK